MSKILHISASIQGENSVSRGLSSKLTEGLAAKSGAEIIERDLSKNDVPFVSANRFEANGIPSEERTPAQQDLAHFADVLIKELQEADTIVLGVPIYNFGVPASVKAWADQVARAGTTFKYTPNGPVGLLEGKKAYITVASGGTAVDSEIDFMTPWLIHFLGFIGITDTEVIAADARMSVGGEEKITAAYATIESLAA